MNENKKPKFLLLDDWDCESDSLPFVVLYRIKQKSFINFNLIEAMHIVNNKIYITFGGRKLVYPNTLHNQKQLGINEKIGFFSLLREW